jgi:DMSO/TMAO reductase YedYZ heme-binding membrane subunit
MSEAVLGKNHTINRSRMLFWLLWVVALSLPMLLWLNHTGNPLDYLKYNAPAGQLPYLLSKLFGLYAFSFLLLQIVLMVMKKSGHLHVWNINLHRNLGLTIFSLILLHAGLFITAKSSRGGNFAYETLIPIFTGGYYKLAVSLGIVSLFLASITVASGMFLKYSVKKSRSKTTHKFALVLVPLTLIHFLWIGSDI